MKYAIYIKLSQYGYKPQIIGKHYKKSNISFLNRTINIRIIKSFREINEKDYDILMVNSDQTWRRWNKDFLNIAFLKFAKNWDIHKFVYGASLGINKWNFSRNEKIAVKELLKNFSDISVREKVSIKLIKKHLGIEPKFVLDPTLLIDKKFYLKIIKNYKREININDNYIFIYKVKNESLKIIDNFIELARIKLNYKIYKVSMFEKEYIEKFIYGIYNCKVVITNSYHGTIFSIIFNKPFISFKSKVDERFNSLIEIFNCKKRIIDYNQNPDLNLLKKPLKINKNNLNSLLIESNNFLKRNLNK